MAGVAVVLFLGSLTWGVWQLREINSLENSLNKERLSSESRLSERLAVEKELSESKTHMAGLEARINNLNVSLEDAQRRSAEKDALVAKSQREVTAGRKKYAELEASKKDAEDQLVNLQATLNQLKANKEELASRIASLEAEADNLKRDLSRAHLAYFDKPLIEPLRAKNDKLMVKASRTQRLKATVMIPNALKDLRFKITDPNGQIISDSADKGTLAVRVSESDQNAITSAGTTAVQGFNVVEMTFLPRKKLSAGTYHIEILSENLAVGSLQLRLR